MNEKKKHKIMLGIEVVLLCMIVAILGTNAASSNPPSNGVSYGKNNQTTVEGALNDLYTKANYGNATASQILKGKTALVGGKQVTGTMENRTSNTGTTGLAWSTSNYQMLGNQLRIGISPGYYGTSNYLSWGTSGIVFDNYQEKLGITADKILKGQSIAGVNGTGETTCPTCLNTSDATATAADISKGKTAYVNGNKITGTGIKGKTYEFNHVKADVSGQNFTGSWIRLVPDKGTYTDFTIDLPFTPSKLESCHVNLYGNYTSTNQNRWDADFRFSNSAGYWYTMNIPNDYYASNSDSVNNYTDTQASCVLDGNKLKFRVSLYYSGTTSGVCAIASRAKEFYLSGVIAYEL